jgi:hypothetical protein
MPIDSSGRRAARIAKLVADVTWWLGLVLCVALIGVFFTAPALEHSGVTATFAWNSVGIDGGHGLPRTTIRAALADSAAPVSLAVTDTTRLAGIRLVGDPVTTVEVRTRRWGVFYAANAMSVAMVLVSLVMVYLVRAFLSAVIADDVFTVRNARRLSTLGWLLVAVGVAGPQLERVRAMMMLSEIRAAGAVGVRLSPANAEGSNTVWLLGVLVLVLAAAWRYGSELQMERDLTV